MTRNLIEGAAWGCLVGWCAIIRHVATVDLFGGMLLAAVTGWWAAAYMLVTDP